MRPKYEQDFIDLSKEQRWRLQYQRGDKTPVLVPLTKTRIKRYGTVAPFSDTKCSITLLAKHGKTKTALLNFLKQKDVPYTIHAEGDTEIIVLFDKSLLPKIVKLFGLKLRKMPPKENLEKARATLEEHRCKSK